MRIAATFANWVNSHLCQTLGFLTHSVTPQPTIKWLHDLGFSPTLHKKGLHFDGHERQDVIEYHQIYQRKLEIIQSTHLPLPTCSTGQTEEIIGSKTVETSSGDLP